MLGLKFRELEVVWAVMKAGSIGAAARLLNVTQPAVSMTLKNAESRLGMPLFVRIAGSAHPTPEARLLFPKIEAVMSAIGEFEQLLGRISEGQLGMVSSAATPALSTVLLRPAIVKFRESHPGTKVAVRTVGSELTADLVARSQVDFGIAYAPAGNLETDTEDLGTTEIVCAFREDDRLRELPEVSPADLVGRTILTYRPESPPGRAVAAAFRAASVPLEIAIQTSSLNVAFLAAAGVGIALVDHPVLSGAAFPDLVVKPFRPASTIRIQLLTHRTQPISQVAREFLAEVRVIAGTLM